MPKQDVVCEEEGEISSAAITDEDVSLANQLRRLRFKRVDVDIIKYLKLAHTELYAKLKTAVRSGRKD